MKNKKIFEPLCCPICKSTDLEDASIYKPAHEFNPHTDVIGLNMDMLREAINTYHEPKIIKHQKMCPKCRILLIPTREQVKFEMDLHRLLWDEEKFIKKEIPLIDMFKKLSKVEKDKQIEKLKKESEERVKQFKKTGILPKERRFEKPMSIKNKKAHEKLNKILEKEFKK